MNGLSRVLTHPGSVLVAQLALGLLDRKSVV